MKRIILAFAMLSACMPSRAADTMANQEAPQKVADRVIAAFRAHRAAQIKPKVTADISILEKGAKDFPKDTRILVALAFCYITQNDKAGYLKNLEKAHALSPKDSQIELSYAVALKMNKQPMKALDVMKGLAADYPSLSSVQYQLALMDIAVQKYDDAIAILEPILQNTSVALADQDKSFYLYSLGICYLYKGDRAKAIENLKQAVALLPQLGVGFEVLGEAYLKDGDQENAGPALDQALALNPHYSAALYYKGILLEKTGKAELAKASVQAAYTNLKLDLNANGENGEDYYLAYLICQKLSKKDEAVKYKAEATQLFYTYDAPSKGK